MPEINTILNATNYQNYINSIPPQEGVIDSLFPERKIDSFELEYVIGADEIPVVASVHAQDSETEIGERESLEVVKHSLAEVRRKIKLSARDAEIIETPRSDTELQSQILKLYNDAFRMVQAVRTRYIAMAWEAFSTGKITFDENGYQGTVDYKMPADNIKGVTAANRWDVKTEGEYKADIIKDLQDWTNLIQSTQNERPNRAITSQKVINIMLQNVNLRSGLFGVNAARILTLNDMNSLFASMGLPTFQAFDGVYRKPKAKGVGTDTVRFTAEDTVILFSEGAQGSRTFGKTDEEMVFARSNKQTGVKQGNVFVDTFVEPDPVALWTRAAAKGLPSFPKANKVFIAKTVISK